MPNKPLQFRLEKLKAEHPYLTERGLTPETIQEFGIGYCEKGVMGGRIAIPIANSSGNIVAYAGRFPGDPPEDTPKYKFPQGFRKSLEVFNAHRAFKEPKEKPLIIVEGFFGCMNLWQHGYRKTVAIMGSVLSQWQEDTIRKSIQQHDHIFVMLDEDDAGKLGREDMVVRLVKFAFVKVCALGEEGRQPENLTKDELACLFGGLPQ